MAPAVQTTLVLALLVRGHARYANFGTLPSCLNACGVLGGLRHASALVGLSCPLVARVDFGVAAGIYNAFNFSGPVILGKIVTFLQASDIYNKAQDNLATLVSLQSSHN